MAKAPFRSLVAAGIPKSSQITPLVIILSFVLLTEVVVMAGVLGTKDFPQLLLTLFCILFPIVIAIPFFWLLAKKPWVFYAPRDYGADIDPQKYISAMSVRVTDSTNRLFNNLPEIIERAALRDADLRRLVSGAENSPEQIVKALSYSIAQEITQSETVSVDLIEFGGDEIKFPVAKDTIISDLLDLVFLEIDKTFPLPPHTYGSVWLLEDKATKKRFLEMGSHWARKNNVEQDSRVLREKGIMPGMTLKAVKP
ncbi:hypothetical protein [Bradyrhizobium liaoningense]|uniref:hypothetical protein n=1 Tax=Bradyrhizobium liaoningense TaxID=43992 RepID=UPI001BA5D44C|nr:hypothetical protein [Bradyrhizobium liaoningense]MBR1172155.1 hypothetical protein [Bradyrhizobium liaoningense]